MSTLRVYSLARPAAIQAHASSLLEASLTTAGELGMAGLATKIQRIAIHN
jgi:hypothetical protein